MVHRIQLCLGNSGGAGDCGIPGDSGVQEMVVLIDSGVPEDDHVQETVVSGDSGATGDAGMQDCGAPGDDGVLRKHCCFGRQ